MRLTEIPSWIDDRIFAALDSFVEWVDGYVPFSYKALAYISAVIALVCNFIFRLEIGLPPIDALVIFTASVYMLMPGVMARAARDSPLGTLARLLDILVCILFLHPFYLSRFIGSVGSLVWLYSIFSGTGPGGRRKRVRKIDHIKEWLNQQFDGEVPLPDGV